MSSGPSDDAPGAAGTGHYALDVVSVIEATLDDPRAILSQQEYKARGEAVGAMKAEGIEYEERMELLEEVTYPKPLAELLGEPADGIQSMYFWRADSAGRACKPLCRRSSKRSGSRLRREPPGCRG